MAYETLLSRIEYCLHNSGLSAAEASRRTTGSPDLIRMLKTGRTQHPRTDTLSKMAEVFGVPVQWLVTGEGKPPLVERASSTRAAQTQRQGKTLDRDVVPAPEARPFSPSGLPQDVPLFGTAAGSFMDDNLAFMLSDDVVDYVRRPPGLARARDVYALRVVHDSMLPRWRPGTIVFVDPHRPVLRGDDVIVQIQNFDGGPIGTMIAEYIGVSGDRTLLQKYNPQNIVKQSTRTILRLHRVLTGNELIGVS